MVNKAIQAAIGFLDKKYGDGIIATKKVLKKFPVISSGSTSVDSATGIGGMPRGRIIEVFGPESSGKTTLALTTAAQAQKMGGAVAYIDVEHAVDLNYAKKLGVNLSDDNWVFSQPDYAEQALDVAEVLIISGAFHVVIIDSVAALCPKAELEGDMDKETMGLQARIMGRAMRKLKGIVNKHQVICIFINQIRDKIGGYGGTTTPGGRALKFYSSIRIEMKGSAKEGYLEVLAKIKKNKISGLQATAEFKISNDGTGIMVEDEIIDFASEFNLIEIKSAWIDMKSLGKFNGRNQAISFLKKNNVIKEKFQSKILYLLEEKKQKEAKEQEEKMIQDEGSKVYKDFSLEDILEGKTDDKKIKDK